ncbi:MAG: prenyltransferase [Ignavibacteria bacterium]|jgi:1,4-dihydroxy-2-naphthoate octaprenyltransferase|nr:prenyltransferase [Ignavibacteria bacterium]MCU7501882.1 prenyltransferase [Ignavibacteria bacterium]MCU7514772.1 prenyltransferase [Ignavibacteria bacterium]
MALRLKNKSFIRDKLISWIKIIRIQFYPMTFIAYSLGSAAALFLPGGAFNPVAYFWGYTLLFFIELLTILLNEYFDFATDKLNKNFSLFTGGTRMLVEGKITKGEIQAASGIVSLLVLINSYLLLKSTPAFSHWLVLTMISVSLVLGVGYTAPPLKFCYRGLGELTVSATHSPVVIMCGFIFQEGRWNYPLPWLLSIPLFFAVMGAITLAGIPDYSADVRVAKRTIPVLLGPRKAAMLSIVFTAMAAAAYLVLWQYEVIRGLAGTAVLLVLFHALILWLNVYRLIKSNDFDRRINSIMQIALSYIIWFGIIPLAYYLL